MLNEDISSRNDEHKKKKTQKNNIFSYLLLKGKNENTKLVQKIVREIKRFYSKKGTVDVLEISDDNQWSVWCEEVARLGENRFHSKGLLAPGFCLIFN